MATLNQVINGSSSLKFSTKGFCQWITKHKTAYDAHILLDVEDKLVSEKRAIPSRDKYDGSEANSVPAYLI